MSNIRNEGGDIILILEHTCVYVPHVCAHICDKLTNCYKFERLEDKKS